MTVVITETLLIKLVFLTLTVTVRLTMITECLLLTTFRPSGVGRPQVSTTTITEKQSKIRIFFMGPRILTLGAHAQRGLQ